MSGYCHDTLVFHPTKEEFSKPFCQYINKVLKKHPDVAMFKVVPPEGWRPRRTALPKLQKLDIQCPIKQLVFGTRGTYRAVLMEQKPLTAFEFRDIAEDDDHLPPNKERDKSDELLERAFWSSVTINPPLYGADTPMSLFDEKLPYGWNLRDLGCLLKRPEVPQVAGVTTPMTYFGMWKSFFAWHVEDADLFSINYLHFGAPKVWYCVSPAHRAKFERMVQSLFPELHKHCTAFMRHKDILLSPALLKNYGIEYMQAKQEPNEFIVLNAGAYHAGYNMGFNVAEAVNFATEEWIEIGRKVVRCKCDALGEGVRISMRLFGCSSGSSGSTDEDDSDSRDEQSGSESGEVSSGERSGEISDEEEPQETRRSQRTSSRQAAAADSSSRKRYCSEAATSPSPSKRSRRESLAIAAVTPSPSPKGPRQTRTSLAAAAAAQKMRRTHATAEARARLAQQYGKVSKRHNKSGDGAPAAGSGRDAGVKKTRLGRPAQVYCKANRLSESLQRAAAAAAAMRARAEAEAAAAGAGQQQLDSQEVQAMEITGVKQEQQHHDLQTQQQLQGVVVKQEPASIAAGALAAAVGILTRRRSSGTNVSAVPAPATPPAAAAAAAAAARLTDPESPRVNKAKLSEGGVVEVAAAAPCGGAPAGEAPHVIIGEEKGSKYFYMVQVLRDVAPRRRGRLVMRWLKEGRDGLFRPSTDTWEEVPGALVAVRTQWVAGRSGSTGGYRLLTLRSRILETEFED